MKKLSEIDILRMEHKVINCIWGLYESFEIERERCAFLIKEAARFANKLMILKNEGD